MPWAAPLLFALLVFGLRFSHIRKVWVDGMPGFADADCYTRMTRVRELLEHGAFIQARHAWENFPQGIIPHTTAPLDWILGGLALLFHPFLAQPLDAAGWIAPPLLAAAGAVALERVSRRLQWGWARLPILLTYAIQPMLVWANAVGRPDHQSLLVPLLCLLLPLELLRRQENRHHLPIGVLWGLALWVSWLEPLVFFLLTAALTPRRCGGPGARQSLPWAAAALGTALAAWALEGFRLPDLGVFQQAEARHWMAQIGELKSPPLLHALTLGLAAPALPVLLILHAKSRRTPQAAPFPLLAAAWTLAALLLALGQQRWMAYLPFPLTVWIFILLARIRSPWARGTWAVLHLLPMAAWLAFEAARTKPDADLPDLRRMASLMKEEGAILAPWWRSPALLYYSGRPIVASSSHQSLPGILDSARFFTTSDFTEADRILTGRGVRWVAVLEPMETFTDSRRLLHGPGADLSIEQREVHRIVLLRLWDFSSVPTRYTLVYASPRWKLYRYAGPDGG